MRAHRPTNLRARSKQRNRKKTRSIVSLVPDFQRVSNNNVKNMEVKTMSVQDVQMRNFFYPNACNVCHVYGKDVTLLRCSSCKMIVYCSLEHQQKHWPLHKEICRVLTDILQTRGQLYTPRKYMENKDIWLVTKTMFTEFVQSKLGRNLTNCELDLLLTPRSCEICHDMDDTKLTNCDDCPYATFCNLHPKDSNHSTKCSLSRLTFESLYMFFCPNNYFECDNYGEDLPYDMRSAITLYESTYRFDKLFKPQKFWTIILSEEISRVYTFLYTIDQLSLPESSQMTVHVVGSNLTEMATAYYWRRVLHHIDDLDELNVVFVGPEINEEYKQMLPCGDYQVDDRQLKMQFVEDYYSHYASSRTFTTPDCVIGFNVGFLTNVMDTDTWAPSLHVLAQLGCPFAWTAVNEMEAKVDTGRINMILKKDVKPLWSGFNPFSSYKPNRNIVTEDFHYTNKYLTIYEKLS